jgi:hypothetical protein
LGFMGKDKILEICSGATIEWFRDVPSPDPLNAYINFMSWLENIKISFPTNVPDSLKLIRKQFVLFASRENEHTVNSYYYNKKNNKSSLRSSRRLYLDQFDDYINRKIKGLKFVPKDYTNNDFYIENIKIVVFTELSSIISPAYHFELIKKLVKIGREAHYLLSWFELNSSNGETVKEISDILDIYMPAAVIFIRISPTREIVDLLSNKDIGGVLIHADRYNYQEKFKQTSILTNIYPEYSNIEFFVLKLKSIIQRHINQQKEHVKIVFVHADEETASSEFDIEEGVDTPSIRNERINRWEKIIENFAEDNSYSGKIKVKHENVDSYSFDEEKSKYIFQQHQDATIIITLSDVIALTIQSYFDVCAEKEKPYVIGFDKITDKISTFEQKFDDISLKAIRAIQDYIREKDQDSAYKIKFKSVASEIKFVDADNKTDTG